MFKRIKEFIELIRLYNKNWDYFYMYKIERLKLCRMKQCFESYKNMVYVDDVIRDLNICINLLDIVLDDKIEYYGYLNGRNLHRFLGYEYLLQHPHKCEDVKSISAYLKSDYRKYKALCLYNKIKTYKSLTWWF